jgi:hypothetical protein
MSEEQTGIEATRSGGTAVARARGATSDIAPREPASQGHFSGG